MRETEKFVFFWETADIYSNWHPSKFEMQGNQFVNSEQAMMYEKAKLMGDLNIMEKVLQTKNPKDIKALGRQVTPWNEDLWQKHRLEIVTKVCLAKFRTNPDMAQKLKNTGGKIIVEASPYDKVWGIGMKDNEEGVENPANWKGLNLLGEALMKVRAML